MIYYHHFGVSLSYKLLFSPFFRFILYVAKLTQNAMTERKEDAKNTRLLGILVATRVKDQLVGQALRCKET